MSSINGCNQHNSSCTKIILIKINLLSKHLCFIFERSDTLQEVAKVIFEVVVILALLYRLLTLLLRFLVWPEILEPNDLRHVIPVMGIQI